MKQIQESRDNDRIATEYLTIRLKMGMEARKKETEGLNADELVEELETTTKPIIYRK